YRLFRGEAVDQDVVVPVGAQRAGKADRIDLDRRRALREQLLARIRSRAVEVEQDGDAVIADALRDRAQRVAADVGIEIEGGGDAPSDRAILAGLQAVGADLESAGMNPLP